MTSHLISSAQFVIPIDRLGLIGSNMIHLWGVNVCNYRASILKLHQIVYKNDMYKYCTIVEIDFSYVLGCK